MALKISLFRISRPGGYKCCGWKTFLTFFPNKYFFGVLPNASRHFPKILDQSVNMQRSCFERRKNRSLMTFLPTASVKSETILFSRSGRKKTRPPAWRFQLLWNPKQGYFEGWPNADCFSISLMYCICQEKNVDLTWPGGHFPSGEFVWNRWWIWKGISQTHEAFRPSSYFKCTSIPTLKK